MIEFLTVQAYQQIICRRLIIVIAGTLEKRETQDRQNRIICRNLSTQIVDFVLGYLGMSRWFESVH